MLADRLANTLPSRTFFPEDFLQETLDTISLLSPSADIPCNAWMRKYHSRRMPDPKLLSLPSTSRLIGRYSHWRDRLLLLEEAFDQSEPDSFPKWWHDRRKKVQRYTFMVAVVVLLLTIFFGLIQSIASIIQAWASLKTLYASGQPSTHA